MFIKVPNLFKFLNISFKHFPPTAGHSPSLNVNFSDWHSAKKE